MAKRGKVKLEIISPENEEKMELERPARVKRYGYIILVVCEDIKTEVKYFNGFISEELKDHLYLKSVGTGENSLGVVQQAVAERATFNSRFRKEVDETWAVFDKDDLDQSDGNRLRFESAFTLGTKEEVSIAYSNESFELWLLLHFARIDPSVALGRREIEKQLQEVVKGYLGYDTFQYVHGDDQIITILFEIGSESDAIERAESLLEFHGQTSLIAANPSTTVYKLINSIRGWIDYFSD